jgi:hypothetical protein
MSLAGAVKDTGEFRPRVGAAHIDNPAGLDARFRWLDAEQVRGLAALHVPPELSLGCQNEVLVERIGIDNHSATDVVALPFRKDSPAVTPRALSVSLFERQQRR